MDVEIECNLALETRQKLEAFSIVLKKDHTTILEEALAQYFKSEEEKLYETGLAQKDPDTDIDFDEFWEDVDI